MGSWQQGLSPDPWLNRSLKGFGLPCSSPLLFTAVLSHFSLLILLPSLDTTHVPVHTVLNNVIDTR